MGKAKVKQIVDTRSMEDDIINLLREQRFWGSVITSLGRGESREVETIGVRVDGGRVSLRYNPDSYFSYPPHRRRALLEHEAMHVANCHFIRRDDIVAGKSIFSAIDPETAKVVTKMHKSCLYRLFNYAADMAINGYIKDIPEDGVFPHAFGFPNNLSVEEYFVMLLKKAVQLPSQAGQGGNSQQASQGDGSRSQQCGGNGRKGEDRTEKDALAASGGAPGEDSRKSSSSGHAEGGESGDCCPLCGPHASKFFKGRLMDDHSGWEASGADMQVAEARVTAIVKECHARGLIPAKFQSMFGNVLAPHIDYNAIIHSFIASCVSDETTRTWLKVSRRLPYVLKGKKREYKLSLLIWTDSSGSISGSQLAKFAALIRKFHKTGARVMVGECDAAVHRVYEFEGKIEKFTGRGGTAFTPAFQYTVENRLHPDAIIYLTDGYGDDPPPFKLCPVLWLVAPGGKRPAAWGRTLFLPKE